MNIEDEPVPPYQENEPRIALWLTLSYILLPILGVIICYIYWNGSVGWLDRGYWHELQQAANTTYPFVNHMQTGLPPTKE